MGSYDGLLRQARQLQASLVEPTEFTFKTIWGGEEPGPLEPGTILIRTQWGTPRLPDDEENEGTSDDEL